MAKVDRRVFRGDSRFAAAHGEDGRLILEKSQTESDLFLVRGSAPGFAKCLGDERSLFRGQTAAPLLRAFQGKVAV